MHVQAKTGPVVVQWHLSAFRTWIAIGLGIGFVVLAMVAHQAKNGTAIDHAVLSWFLERRSNGLTAAAVAVTDIGSPLAMSVFALIAGVTLWWRNSLASGLVTAATLGAAYCASTMTKVIAGVHRPPPNVHLVFESDASYPSGHVTGTVALLGMLAVAIGIGRSTTIRILMAAGVAMVALVVAASRLYLGVHWLTDVVGGSLLGGMAVALGSGLLRVDAAHCSKRGLPTADQLPNTSTG